MVEPRSREGDGPLGLRVERVDVLPTDLGTVIVRVAGRWEGAPLAGVPVLVVPTGTAERRFDPLPATSGASERVAPEGSFRAAFSVSGELRPALAAGLAMEIAGRRMELPGASEAAPERPVGGTLVDRAVLAERRARRAELSEETHARRAEEAEAALAALEGELASLELRLEQARTERGELEERLADSARDARAATQRAHAERQLREEEREETAARVDESEGISARLRDRAHAADTRATELAREAEELRRRVAEAEQTAAAAEAARHRAEEVAQRASSDAAGAQRRAEDLAAEAQEVGRAAREGLDEARRRADSLEEELSVGRARQAERAARIRAEHALAQRARDTGPPAFAAAPAIDVAAAGALLDAEARVVRAHGAPGGETAVLREEARRAAAAVSEATWSLAEAEDALGGAVGAAARERELREAAEARVAEIEAAREQAEAMVAAETSARRALERELAAERERAAAEARSQAEVQARAARAIEEMRARVEELQGVAAEARRTREAEEALRGIAAAAGRALREAETRIGEARDAAASMQDRLDREREDAETRLSAELGERIDAATESIRADLEGRIAGLESALADERAARERAARERAEAALARNGVEAPPAPEPKAVEPEAKPQSEETTAEPAPSRPPRRRTDVEPWLPVGLRHLAADDPVSALRLGLQLLPGQALGDRPERDYDLEAEGVGWHAVTLRHGKGTVAPLDEPRGRRQTDFRVSLDGPALAELLAGGGSRSVRRAGHARVRGTLRRRRALKGFPASELDLGVLAEAGVWPDPGLVLASLGYLIDPEWTRGGPFSIALQIVGPRGGRWAVDVPGDAALAVSPGTPRMAAATVRMSQAAFQRLLAGDAGGAEGKASIRGDVNALARLVEWVERAQRNLG